jgi:hypothetical protein
MMSYVSYAAVMCYNACAAAPPSFSMRMSAQCWDLVTVKSDEHAHVHETKKSNQPKRRLHAQWAYIGACTACVCVVTQTNDGEPLARNHHQLCRQPPLPSTMRARPAAAAAAIAATAAAVAPLLPTECCTTAAAAVPPLKRRRRRRCYRCRHDRNDTHTHTHAHAHTHT